MPRKLDYPPILPDGLHQKNLEEVQVLCVDAFPLSASRVRLMAGLRAMVDLLTTDGVSGNLWVDGSFLTKKLEPEDVDITAPIWKRSKLRLVTTSTMRCWLNSTAMIPLESGVTRQRSAMAASRGSSGDALIRRTFRHPTWSVRTGPSEPRCGATRVCLTDSAER